MLKKYKTTLNNVTEQIEVKKSKFISNVFQISSEEEAQKYIEEIRKANPKAVHNVYAYMCGYNNEIVRQSDDGEPSGTSGMPTLDVILKEDIKNTLIVTTRYFGGTLLGTGGLVSAYGSSAKLAVERSHIFEKELYIKHSITCPYDLHGKLQYTILNSNNYLEDTIFSKEVEMIIYTPIDDFNKFTSEIMEITKGTISPQTITKIYCAYINEKFIVFEELKEN
ncbi:MAG: YigZ family protein [Lachnospirales bacterium]